MVARKTAGSRAFDCFNYFILALLMFITLYPFLYVVFASFSEASKMEVFTGALWRPLGFSTEAYKAVFQNPSIWSGYRNTLFLVVVGTALNLFFTSLAAYVLSRKTFAYRRPITLFIVFTMFFGGGLIPTYLLVQDLGLIDSLWSCILPGLVSTYNFLIMRTFFEGIPASLEESAKLDGANDFLILFRIILPLSGPIIAVMVLFFGVGHWNQWFNAMIYLQDEQKYPLQLVLRQILLANSTDSMLGDTMDADKAAVGETIKYATIIVATVPILCVYPFLQKYFVKGVMIGAIKG